MEIVGSTLAIYDGDVAIVAPGTAITSVGPDGQAQYVLDASLVPITLDYSTDWSIDWELLDSNSFSVPITQSAHLVKKPTHPVIDANTMLNLHQRLVSNGHYTPEKLQKFPDEAWILLDSWLRRDNLYLEEWLEASALGPPHLSLSFSLMFADMAKDAGGHWAAERDRYWDRALLAYNSADGKGDSNQDGKVDGRQHVTPLYAGPFAKVAGAAR